MSGEADLVRDRLQDFTLAGEATSFELELARCVIVLNFKADGDELIGMVVSFMPLSGSSTVL